MVDTERQLRVSLQAILLCLCLYLPLAPVLQYMSPSRHSRSISGWACCDQEPGSNAADGDLVVPSLVETPRPMSVVLAPLSLQLFPSPSNNTTSNTNIITENHTIHKVRISPSSSTAYTSKSTQLAQIRGSQGCEPSPVAPSPAPRTRAQSTTTCTINLIRSSSSLTRYRATSSLTSPAAEPALVHKVCNDSCVNLLLQFDTHIT
jgi:hypothetical protein